MVGSRPPDSHLSSVHSTCFPETWNKITQHVRRLTLTLVRLRATKPRSISKQKYSQLKMTFPNSVLSLTNGLPTPREVRSAMVINFWHLKTFFHYLRGVMGKSYFLFLIYMQFHHQMSARTLREVTGKHAWFYFALGFLSFFF